MNSSKAFDVIFEKIILY